jgi:hypothetical protein
VKPPRLLVDAGVPSGTTPSSEQKSSCNCRTGRRSPDDETGLLAVLSLLAGAFCRRRSGAVTRRARAPGGA